MNVNKIYGRSGFFIQTLIIALLVGLLVAFEAIHWAIALVFSLLFIIITIKKSIVIVFLILFLLPLHGFLVHLGIPKPLHYWKEFLILFGFTITILKYIIHRSFKFDSLSLIILVYFLYFILRAISSPDIKVSMLGIPVYILYVLWYFIVLAALKSLSNVKSSIKYLICASILVSCGGILQTFFSWEILKTSDALEVTRLGIERASFSVGSSIVFGSLMAIAAAFVLSKLLLSKTSLISYLGLSVILTILTYGLIISMTRGAWLQFGVSFVTIVIIGMVKKQKQFISKVGFLHYLLTVGIMVLLYGNLSRIITFLSSSIETRDYIWLNSLKIFTDKPIFGFGIGETLWSTRMLRGSDFVTESFILQIMVESGVLGLMLFMGILVITFRSLLNNIKRVSIENLWLPASAFAVLLGLFTNMLVAQSVNAWVINMIFWFLIAVANVFNKQ